MRDVTSTGPTPSRRLVTAGALGAVVAVLSGCGIRLEDDAPRVPLVPTRSPIAGEDALLRFLAAVQSAALAPVDPRVAFSALLAPLHQRQARVLHDALRQRGVPQDELPSATPSPTPSPTGSASAAVTSSATPSTTNSASPSASPSVAVAPATLATVEGAIVAASRGCEEAAAELRPTLLAVLAQAHAALDLAAPTTPATPAPSASPSVASAWSAPSVVAPLITAVRTASYFLEVAAARSDPAVRRVWLRDLAELHSLTAELVEAAGDAAPAPELGRALPHAVTTPAQAATLATEAMATLLGAFGTALPTLSASDTDATTVFATVPRWLGTVAALAQRHGIPLSAFPGLA